MYLGNSNVLPSYNGTHSLETALINENNLKSGCCTDANVDDVKKTVIKPHHHWHGGIHI